jgi:hypothetical protein
VPIPDPRCLEKFGPAGGLEYGELALDAPAPTTDFVDMVPLNGGILIAAVIKGGNTNG